MPKDVGKFNFYTSVEGMRQLYGRLWLYDPGRRRGWGPGRGGFKIHPGGAHRLGSRG